MIDTHAHLNFTEYQKDLDKIVQRAKKSKVKKIICVSSNLAESRQAIKIAQKYPGLVYAAVGIHPQQTDPENTEPVKKQLKALEKLAKDELVVAIGECGLDFSPAPPGEKDRNLEDQINLFEGQIRIAQELKLPLIIHSREAFDKTRDILSQYINASKQKLRGVFHCYSAGKKKIKDVLSLDFYFGVDGNLTYDIGLQNVFSQIPLEKTLLETDSPFLTPVPKRGKRNEPSLLPYIAKKLSEIKETTLDAVESITDQNAERLFGI